MEVVQLVALAIEVTVDLPPVIRSANRSSEGSTLRLKADTKRVEARAITQRWIRF